ncbi:FtsW/RodA/SpoVE family cell cycle protein [Nonomuraea aridisoli]|uniref:FtsW/RodA/SpoVE family cell cycle protein n=1 Tax=Nonomuraea aridisoli TaxID=2070368 RepID=UPI001F32DFCA|nr:FtsW/RodA/SpoVE family cell cycle protein [Nonomuraea aridisoli]
MWAPSLGAPDRVLAALAAALSAVGLLLVWSATRMTGDHTLLVRQAVAVAGGLVLMWLVSRVDLRVLRAYVPAAYVLAVLALAAVLSPLGERVNGAHSWIVLAPGLQFQPSELAKVALALAFAVPLGLVRPYQLERLLVLANPAADPGGAGYNAAQARIAIGSGGLYGKGLFNGEQTAGHFVPEQHTDFVFTVAGEELGFAGAAAVVLALCALLWRGLSIARDSASPYGTVLAWRAVSWIGFQAFVNVGMTVGLTPIVGVPLPFVSYGGSATVAGLVAVGLLQAVHRTKPMQP